MPVPVSVSVLCYGEVLCCAALFCAVLCCGHIPAVFVCRWRGVGEETVEMPPPSHCSRPVGEVSICLRLRFEKLRVLRSAHPEVHIGGDFSVFCCRCLFFCCSLSDFVKFADSFLAPRVSSVLTVDIRRKGWQALAATAAMPAVKGSVASNGRALCVLALSTLVAGHDSHIHPDHSDGLSAADFAAIALAEELSTETGGCVVDGQWWDGDTTLISLATDGGAGPLKVGTSSSQSVPVEANCNGGEVQCAWIWAAGTAVSAPSTGQVANISLVRSDGETVVGSVQNNCSSIAWDDGSVWKNLNRQVSKVHIVQMTHFDVGYVSSLS